MLFTTPQVNVFASFPLHLINCCSNQDTASSLPSRWPLAGRSPTNLYPTLMIAALIASMFTFAGSYSTEMVEEARSAFDHLTPSRFPTTFETVRSQPAHVMPSSK